MAVGWGFNDQLGADDGAGPGAILHDDLAAETLGETLRKQPGDRVACAAGGGGYDDANGAGWVRRGLRV